jgi:putative membrane protein
MRALREEDKTAFVEATQAIEAESSVEVVVSVRRQSATYLHVPFVVAALASIGTLAFALYSDHIFSIRATLLDPIIIGLLVGLLSARSWTLTRWLSSRKTLVRQVNLAAKACFLRKKVHKTTGRTGLLLYISQRERVATLVVDVGIEEVIAADELEAHEQALNRLVRAGRSGAEVARELTKMAALLGERLPAGADDVNELADGVDPG